MGDGEKKNILDNYSDVLTPVDLMSIFCIPAEHSPIRCFVQA